jgi:hypothetical protein
LPIGVATRYKQPRREPGRESICASSVMGVPRRV